MSDHKCTKCGDTGVMAIAVDPDTRKMSRIRCDQCVKGRKRNSKPKEVGGKVSVASRPTFLDE